MRTYELALIVNPNVDAEGREALFERVKEMVQTAEGTVDNLDIWGRRRLGYPIRNYKEGTYALFNVSLPPHSITQVERNIQLTDEIIRYMLIKAED